MIHIANWFKRKDGSDEQRPHAFSESKSLLENPYKKYEVEPDYWNLDGTVLDFCIFILEGYIWEAKNSQTFVAHHPELPKVHQLVTHMKWVRDNDKFWPQEDEWIQLALIDFVRLLPALWD